MRVSEEGASEVGDPVGAEPELDTGETQSPFRTSVAIEDSSAHSPAAFDDQSRIDGIAALLGLSKSRAQGLDAMGAPPALAEFRVAFEVCIHIVGRKEGQDCEPGACDAEGETHALAQHERADGKRPFFSKQTHRLICAPYRQERALLGLDRQ